MIIASRQTRLGLARLGLAMIAPPKPRGSLGVMAQSASRPDCLPLVSPTQILWQAPDMTATIGADARFCDLYTGPQGDDGLWLPIDCQGNPHQTIGKLVERNSTGPLRLGFGGWRDLLLGCQFINGNGELITAGGRTVKNVAGYDLTKFMIGQAGIFGRIVSITMRAHPRPQDAILAEFPPDIEIFNNLIVSNSRPQWAVFTEKSLFCGYLGNMRLINYQAEQLPSWKPNRLERGGLAYDCQWRLENWRANGAGELSMRASLPPATITEFASKSGLKDWVADPAFGIVLATVSDESAQSVTDAATAAGGRAWFWRKTDAYGLADFFPSPAERTILERLKGSFDPENVLSPLPWS